MNFREDLKVGLLGEGRIARWLMARGNVILPAYEVEESSGKGPRLFTGLGGITAPDLLAIKNGKVVWVEAKVKSAFTWHRGSGTWQTGIDLKHWRSYLRVAKVTGFPVWLLFLHCPWGSVPGAPEGMESPTGLFGNTLERLQWLIHHEHENHGTSGMVYWAVESLWKLAEYESIAG